MLTVRNHPRAARAALTRGEPVVQVRKLWRYSAPGALVRPLTDISFEAQRGEVVGLLGPVGSGKSTLLRILAGRLSASEGKARVFGRAPRRRAVRSRIGYLPQGSACLHPRLGGKVLDVLRPLFNRQPAKPGGDKTGPQTPGAERRSQLKQIFAKSPDLLLLDEPFLGLERAAEAELKELLRGHAHQGRTVVIASSSVAELKDVCDRLLLLFGGRIEAGGTLPQLLTSRESLRYLVDCLPKAAAEHVLEGIRRDLGVPSGAPKAAAGARPSPDAGISASDLALEHCMTRQTSELPALGDGRTPAEAELGKETMPAVNHQMLTALTRTAPELPAQPAEEPPGKTSADTNAR